jgi:glycosyltransferase involved in cell wall biosynthesis
MPKANPERLKAELAKLQCEAKVWVYPTWFHETFCISAVENAAAGNALIYSDIGGLKTTIGGAGIVIPPDGIISNRTGDYPDAVATDIINATVSLLTDEQRREHYAALAAHKTESYTWGKAADGWIAQFDKT